jgi:hypothetical protein
MLENCFWGEVGIQINAFMSGTAWNLKKMTQKLREEFLRHFLQIPGCTRCFMLQNCENRLKLPNFLIFSEIVA